MHKHYSQSNIDRHGIRRLPAVFEQMMEGAAEACCTHCYGRGWLMSFDAYGEPIVDGPCPDVVTLPELHRRDSI